MLSGQGRLSNIPATLQTTEAPTPPSLPPCTILISHPFCPLRPIIILRITPLNLPPILLSSSNNKQPYPHLLVRSSPTHQVKVSHRALQLATVVFMRCHHLVFRVPGMARLGSGHQGRIAQGRARAQRWKTCPADSHIL